MGGGQGEDWGTILSNNDSILIQSTVGFGTSHIFHITALYDLLKNFRLLKSQKLQRLMQSEVATSIARKMNEMLF